MQPLWKGPTKEGITFSLLSKFLVCRERFRLMVVEGLAPIPAFNHRIEYGNMWHVCEEATFAGDSWQNLLKMYSATLCQRYPMAQEQVGHWYAVCLRQYPLYLKHYAAEADHHKALAQEQVFRVPYKLSNGVTVYLKGKWDGVFLADDQLWLMEHKTKGDINELAIEQQLSFDLQTMLYYVALTTWAGLKGTDREKATPLHSTLRTTINRRKLSGILYNVVRRPLSGGKGSIKQKQGETTRAYYDRVAAYIEDDPKHYFIQKWVRILPSDVVRFRETTLDPLLHGLIQWWDWVTSKEVEKFGPFHDGGGWGVHWRHPFGVHNPLNDGGHTDLDAFLATGSKTGLCKITNLFPELT